jgi:hypothetical protein
MKSLSPLPHVACWLLPFACVAFTAGCSSDTPDPGNSSAGSGGNTGGTPANAAGTANGNGAAGSGPNGAEPQGSVVVSLNPPVGDSAGYSTLIGRFFAGPTPDPFPLKLDSKSDGCELLVPLLPFCSEACTPDVCTANDVCTPYPEPLGVGPIAVIGLGAELSLMPATSMVVYQSPSLAYPPCAEGSKVKATSASFALEAECLAPLELTGPDPLPVKAGQVVHVTWQAAAAGSKSRIRIGLDVSHHGGKKGQIDCEVPDTGSFDIPEPLVTKLLGLGLAGYPTINVNRVSVGVDTAHPDVSLLLSSAITRAVDTGVMSCQDDAECPDGKTCAMVGICE